MNDIITLRTDLEDKFSPNEWNGWKVFNQYKHTGKNLIDQVNSLKPKLVIDAGCGHNRFKGHIKNLIGFDQEPFPFVDIVSNIESINFRKESADVVLVLGSIQFGNKEFVKSQMKKVTSWVKPGGFIIMRTMKNWYRPEPYPHQDAHYIWSLDDIKEIGLDNNLQVIRGVFTEKIKSSNEQLLSTRLAWWYKKL
jgi:hypothetical protein